LKTKRQVGLFILVGGLNTLFGYLLYALFIFMQIPYPIALLLSTCIGALFNFKTTGTIVFGNANNDYFFKFITMYVLVYFINMFLIKLMGQFTSNLYLAGFVALIPAAATAFLLNKYIVFREEYETN
jgi:putative flippase GtrA